MTVTHDEKERDKRAEMERAADDDNDFDTIGEIDINELRDDVKDTRAELEVEGERVVMPEKDAEGLSERDATEVELDLIDRDIDGVNVAIAVNDGVLTPERDTIDVTVTTLEFVRIGVIDSLAVGL